MARSKADGMRATVTRHIVAWIVEGKRLPDYQRDYDDSKSMKGQKRFFVVCDYLPKDQDQKISFSTSKPPGGQHFKTTRTKP